MENYYRILNVDTTASEEKIKEAIKRELRLWSNRTNAPQIERRQEAERMVKLLEEAEEILLDATKRSEYDRELRSAPTQEQQVGDDDLRDKEDLVHEGWQLLIAGNIPDALYVATKATEKEGNNPEAWSLLAQAKFRWGEIDDAIYEYKRAIKLRPNEASYYFDIGSVYESIEQWNDALQQYQRAAQIDPASAMYRAAIGILFIKNERFKEGIELLEHCVEEEPDNETYQWFLAIAYTESTYQNWTFVSAGGDVESGYYATEKEHIEEAQQYIDKAEKLKFSDSELSEYIRSVKQNIASMLERKFHGNWLVAAAAIVVGIIALASGEGGAIVSGLFYAVCGGLYIKSCMTPQYILNRRIIAGRGGTSASFLAGEGCLWKVIGLVILLPFLPFMVIYNFIKNYAISK